MKSKPYVTIANLGMFVLLVVVSTRAADQCADILKAGIFNVTTVNQSVGIKNDYNAWLCTTEFHTHQEANDAGVAVGFPVYDIPIQIGLTFKDSDRDTWKSTNCSGQTDRSQYSATYQKVVSEIQSNSVNAWRDCMIALYSTRIGLGSVALAHGPRQVSMKIKWQPYDGFDTRLPKVTGYSMIGATQATVGSTLCQVGVNVPATETNLDFVRQSPHDPVTLTLNTDRGSVTAYVPPETMHLEVSASLLPTVEKKQVATKDYAFYEADPDDDCVRDLNFDRDYYPPDGYGFTSYTFEETTKNGDRTSYSSSAQSDRVHFHMHVQGDDGTFGFCKRHGWLGLSVHVTGQRWVPTTLTRFDTGEVTYPALQQSVLIHYPYLSPSVDVRNFQLPFVATVRKVIGDDAATLQLSNSAPSAAGITTAIDPISGNLTIDATKAFADWIASMSGNGNPSSALSANANTSNSLTPVLPTTAKPNSIDMAAAEACKKLSTELEVFTIETNGDEKSFRVICGTPPKAIANSTTVLKPFAVTVIKVGN
jgi:hypothetical protein